MASSSTQGVSVTEKSSDMQSLFLLCKVASGMNVDLIITFFSFFSASRQSAVINKDYVKNGPVLAAWLPKFQFGGFIKQSIFKFPETRLNIVWHDLHV